MRCCESIIFNASRPYELIVVDNGSDDGKTSELRNTSKSWKWHNLEQVKMKVFRKPQSLPKAWNTAIDMADGDTVFLINNDMIFQEGNWMEMLTDLLNQGYGVVGGQAMSWNGIGFIEGALIAFPKKLALDLQIKMGEYFDERFILTCEDVDFCHRAQHAGVKIAQVVGLNAKLLHLADSTINLRASRGEDMYAIMHESRREFCRKWGLEERIND